MIQGTALMRRRTRKGLVSTSYWKAEVTSSALAKCVTEFETSSAKTHGTGVVRVQNGALECFVVGCTTQYALVFITDGRDKVADIEERMKGASTALARLLKKKGLGSLKERYAEVLSRYVYSHLRIAIVGEAGVGKTSTLHLLKGLVAPSEYRPTIGLDTEVVETVHFGNHRLMILDFAGQETARKFWDLSDSHLIILLTDSTIRGVASSKEILSKIHRDLPMIPVIVIANKQDLPNALDASIIARLMGRETYPLVAVDLAFRDELLMTIINAAAERFKIELPDISRRELLSMIDDSADYPV